MGIWGPLGRALYTAKTGKKFKSVSASTRAVQLTALGTRKVATIKHLTDAAKKIGDEPVKMARDNLALGKGGTASHLGLGGKGKVQIPPRPPVAPQAAHPVATKTGPRPVTAPAGVKPHGLPVKPDVGADAAKAALQKSAAEMRELSEELGKWITNKRHSQRHLDRLQKEAKYAKGYANAVAAQKKYNAAVGKAAMGNATARSDVTAALHDMASALAEMAGA